MYPPWDRSLVCDRRIIVDVSSVAKRWLIVFGVAEVVVLALTLHAHFTFHSNGGPNSPSVMSVGQLLGWFFSAALLIAMILLVAAARQSARYRGDIKR
jgi:hypothetical protein